VHLRVVYSKHAPSAEQQVLLHTYIVSTREGVGWLALPMVVVWRELLEHFLCPVAANGSPLRTTSRLSGLLPCKIVMHSCVSGSCRQSEMEAHDPFLAGVHARPSYCIFQVMSHRSNNAAPTATYRYRCRYVLGIVPVRLARWQRIERIDTSINS
jgi:hypothetical protein